MLDGAAAPIILVGDGRSDFCPAAQATLVLAKKSLATHCRNAGIEHIKIENFSDATRALRALYAFYRARRLREPAEETGVIHA
jgi:2-hydroxy-3-keto-5-methylthiopentenyl-1-phosphate phosphatase